MCSLVSNKHPNNKNKKLEEDNQHEESENPAGVVTRQLYLKPAGGNTTGTLDKVVVLRRIRHRRRINKVRSAVQALLISSPFASGADDNNKSSSVDPQLRWVDDAFTSP